MCAMGETAPIVVREAVCERLEDDRVEVRLHGERRSELPPDARLLLAVESEGRSHRFPPVPEPRQTVGAGADAFTARFVLPDWIANALGEPMTLHVGELAVPVPPAGDVPLAPVGGGPLRSELAARARSEARLIGELAELRARLDAREAGAERVQALADELAAELERVRALVGAEADRRREVESRSMVLAAELAAAQVERDEALATAGSMAAERDALQDQVTALEAELTTIEGELERVRAAAEGAGAAREAASTELEAMRDEIERLGTERGAVAAAATDSTTPELERAEALLAEARALRSSLES